MKKRLFSALLALMLVCSLLTLGVSGEEMPTLHTKGVQSINKYGALLLDVSHGELLSVFDYGDIVTVSFGEITIDVPIVTAYSCVDSGTYGLFLQMEGEVEEVKLGINMGNLSEVHSIAYRPDPDNAPKDWVYLDGYSAETEFTFTLKEKAGYLEQFLVRSMAYTDDRADYPNLTDAQFGNFRPVVMGRIAPGVLYRSATAVDPKRSRNVYVNAAAEEAGVTVFLDMADMESSLSELEGYPSSRFASQTHYADALGMDFSAPSVQGKLADMLRFMAAHPGVYDIFCLEGKDRTGFVLALLESLMGASQEEICADYMLSYYNYYGLTPEDEGYAIILEGNLLKTFRELVSPNLENLEADAEAFLRNIGLTDGEIQALKANLSGPEPAPAPTDAVSEPTETEPAEPQHSRNGLVLPAVILCILCLGLLLARKLYKKHP